MSNFLSVIQSIVPEMSDVFSSRLAVLRALDHSNIRIGRKTLADETQLTERMIRTMLETLKDQALVDVSYQGVRLTQRGKEILELIDEHILTDGHMFYELEEAMKRKFGLRACYIVSGDADNDSRVYQFMGEVLQSILVDYLPEGVNVIAVTGGKTLARVAQSFTPAVKQNRDITFVPSRGGFGGTVDIQSNSVGSLMAERTDAQYLPLFIPENLNEYTSELLLKDENIRNVVTMSQQANCLLLSVGTAEVMADRRNINEEQRQLLKDKHAVGEAFGVFFDQEGQSVLRYPRIGLTVEDLANIPLLISIVGGSSKAEALEAFFKLAPSRGILLCDEGVAKKILNGETL